ncbi:MAG: VWA domain-containing protein [Methanomassiliicoccus sp.]|nr:MAG: VWA domain-containing protein [Methanomassiliicoccus sp.]
MNQAGVTEVISQPHLLLFADREFLATVMALDLLGEEPQLEVNDLPSLVLRSLFQGRAWKDVRKLVDEHAELAPTVLRELLPKVLNMAERALDGLDWSELPAEERHRTEEALEWLLNAVDGKRDGDISPEQRKALLLVMRMLVRALDRNIAPLVEKLRQDAEVLVRLEELLPGQGWDLNRVALHRTFLGNLERYALILRRHRDVERLKEMLGRMNGEKEHMSYSFSHSSSETHSLRFSGDLQRMLPQELVNLGDERLKLLFYARMCEKRLLTYQLRGHDHLGGERKRGGPVVALLDSSGSMSGEAELAAKALLLALAHRLLEDRRSLRALLFSVEVQGYDLTGPDGSSQMLDFLCHSFGGGTDFDAALRHGMKSLEEPSWQGADILFITDGLARIKDRGCLHDWNCLKERQGSRIFTVIVGGTEAGGLQRISDQVFLLNRQGEWEGGSLLKEITPQSRSAGSCWVTR